MWRASIPVQKQRRYHPPSILHRSRRQRTSASSMPWMILVVAMRTILPTYVLPALDEDGQKRGRLYLLYIKKIVRGGPVMLFQPFVLDSLPRLPLFERLLPTEMLFRSSSRHGYLLPLREHFAELFDFRNPRRKKATSLAHSIPF